MAFSDFFLLLLIFTTNVSSISICTSNSIISLLTDPACVAWCKARLCSTGRCERSNGAEPECLCESCSFSSIFGDGGATTQASVDNQYYNAGSAGAIVNPRFNSDQQQNSYNRRDATAGSAGQTMNNYDQGRNYNAENDNSRFDSNSNEYDRNEYASRTYNSGNDGARYGHANFNNNDQFQNQYPRGYQNIKK